MHTCVYTHIHIHTYMYTYIYIYVCYVYVYIYIYICVFGHICKYLKTDLRVFMCVYTCIDILANMFYLHTPKRTCPRTKRLVYLLRIPEVTTCYSSLLSRGLLERDFLLRAEVESICIDVHIAMHLEPPYAHFIGPAPWPENSAYGFSLFQVWSYTQMAGKYVIRARGLDRKKWCQVCISRIKRKLSLLNAFSRVAQKGFAFVM